MVFFVYEKKTAVPVLAYEALVTKEYNIFMEHDFWHKIKSIILTHTMALATNIPVLLRTAFVLQGHIYVDRSSIYKRAKHL